MTLVGAEGLQRRLRAIGSREGQRGMMGALGKYTQAQAQKSLRKGRGRKTGNLSREIKVENVTDTSVTVRANTNYAAHVEFGTRPHIIRARRAKALRFEVTSGGRRLTGTPRRGAQNIVFVPLPRVVHHPGTKAIPYLRPAAEKALRDSGIARDSIITRWNGAD